MKKSLRLVSLLIISICMMAMLFSCKKKESTGSGGASDVGNLGAFTMKMEDNFQYSDGYQGRVTATNMLGGKALVAGETYNLKLKFTASRDLENVVFLGFADTTEAANWWKWLSMEGDGSDDQVIPGSHVKAGQEVSVDLTLNILYDPTSENPAANALIFETRGEGTPGFASSGVQKPFDINFTEFVLTKK